MTLLLWFVLHIIRNRCDYGDVSALLCYAMVFLTVKLVLSTVEIGCVIWESVAIESENSLDGWHVGWTNRDESGQGCVQIYDVGRFGFMLNCIIPTSTKKSVPTILILITRTKSIRLWENESVCVERGWLFDDISRWTPKTYDYWLIEALPVRLCRNCRE